MPFFISFAQCPFEQPDAVCSPPAVSFRLRADIFCSFPVRSRSSFAIRALYSTAVPVYLSLFLFQLPFASIFQFLALYLATFLSATDSGL